MKENARLSKRFAATPAARMTVAAWIAVCLSGTLAASVQTPAERIEEVLIVGNRRIQESTIRFYIQTKENDAYNEGQVLRDYRSLLRTNFFENATVKKRQGETGVIIVFEVEERPLIREIVYEGVSSFKESDILERFRDMRVGMTVDNPYDPSKIPLARRAIGQLLDQNGRPLGRVEVATENITSASVKVTFQVDEGPKVRIGDISFSGNTVLKEGELRDALELNKERGLLTVFKGTDKYIKDKLEYDIQVNLLAEYKRLGYIYARAGEPTVEIVEAPRGFIPGFRKTKQQYYIDIPIEEGEQYKVGSFKVEGIEKLPPQFVEAVYNLKPGDILNMTALREMTDQLQKFYSQRGYLDMDALPEINPDPATKTADVKIEVTEGRQYLVNHIEFAGNTRTRDKVLRREFVLEEQQQFDGNRLDISVLRLNQLGYFEKIEEEDYEVIKKPDDAEVDVLVKVKERSSQSIGVTGGVSGISGSFFGVNYSTNNFRGLGQRIDVSILAGTRSTLFNFSMTDPYFLDTRTSTGWSVFKQRYRYDTLALTGFLSDPTNNITLFTRVDTGFSVSASRPWKHWARLGLRYSLTSTDITDIADQLADFANNQLVGFTPGGDPNAAANGLIRSEITPSFVFNTKNAYYDATQGRSLTVEVPFAGGPLGGTYNLIRPYVEYQHFIPDRLFSGGRNTWAFRASFLHILPYGTLSGGQDMQIPFFERIFTGGEFTLRGFEPRSVSPIARTRTPQLDSAGNPLIDPVTGLPLVSESAVAIGGDTRVVGTAEYRFPVVGPLKMAGFVDFGTSTILDDNGLQVFGPGTFIQLVDSTNNVWRMSTGLEIQFLMPVVNQPFRLILAYNPLRLTDSIVLGGRRRLIEEPRTNVRFTVGYNF